MLNEIIKTAEELNTAALYYRQSGNMDGVRELAKAHAVSKKQTEEFIQGSRYRLDHALHGSPIIRSMICLLMRTWTRLRL